MIRTLAEFTSLALFILMLATWAKLAERFL
jgi:hypothetical protein